MRPKATIACECGCIFEVDYQKSTPENSPICPQCQRQMDEELWKVLRDIMARYADFSQHMVKWSLERQEPRMEVPVITVQTF